MRVEYFTELENIKAGVLKGISWRQGFKCYLETPFLISASLFVSVSSFLADQIFIFPRPYGIKMDAATSSNVYTTQHKKSSESRPKFLSIGSQFLKKENFK